MAQHQRAKNKTRRARQDTEIQKKVHSGQVEKSKSTDKLTITLVPSISLISGATESGGGGVVLEPSSSQLEVLELALADSERQPVDDSDDSQDGEYVNDESQVEKTEEEEEEEEEEDDDELEQHENGNLSSGWGAQRPIGNAFPESQPSILTITSGHTQSSGEVTYPTRSAPVPVPISQNRFTSTIPSRSPTVLNRLETPAITPSHPDLITPKLDSSSEQQTSSRRNMTTGLERSIVLKACDLMWDWTLFVNPFPDVITLNEAVVRCWKDARRELGFPSFPDATQASSDLVSCPYLNK